jgi:HEAT repeat protein
MKCILALAGLVVGATLAHGADVKDLIKQLKDGDNDGRRAAAKALADGGAESKDAVPALIHALKDRDTFVRRFSAQALGEIGPDAKSAVPALTTALDDAKKEVQSAAAAALGKVGPSGVETLVGILKNDKKDPMTRRQAIASLSNVGSGAKSAVPALTEIVKEKPPGKGKNKNKNAPEDLRIDAATALGTLATADDKETIETLQALLDKKSKAPRGLKQAANMALRKIRTNQ